MKWYFVCLFWCFRSQVNSYGRGRTVSSPIPHSFPGVKLEQAVNQGGEKPLKLFCNQSPRKYGTRPGSNPRPLDLQSDSHLLPETLPTALCGRGVWVRKEKDKFLEKEDKFQEKKDMSCNMM